MKKRFILLLTAFFASGFLSGCGFLFDSSAVEVDAESLVQTMVAQTMMPVSLAETMVAQTLAAQPAQSENGGTGASASQLEEVLEETPAPSMTPTRTPTPTQTQTPTLSVPMVHVSVDTNCRVGPGKVYDWLGALTVGEAAEVLARSADGQYWVIRNPDHPGGTCWLWGNYATVEGPIGNLPVWDPPPTPTPSRDWTGAWSAWVEGESSGEPFYVAATMSIHVSGDNFTGTLTIMSQTVDINGYLNADRSVASGTWTSPSDSGPFVFYWVDETQFRGNYDGTLGWCGAREGVVQPNPCFAP